MLYLLITAFLSALSLTYFVRKLALKNQIVDIPNERSSHSVPTPRGGGVAIAIVWYIGLVVCYIAGWIESTLFFALISGIILSVISLIDDIKNLSPKIRIIAQFLSAALALFALGGFSSIDMGVFQLENKIMLTVFAIPFIIWFINLFNFLDGIDGYLGMEGVSVSVGLWILTGNHLLLLFSAAILGFLVWNWPIPKAKIFCGDVGSTLIGFNVAIFAIYFQNTQQLSLIVPIMLSGLFWFDATLTLFRRWRNKETLSEAHRKHAYQRIVQSGFSHAKSVYYAMALNAIILSIGIFVSDKPSLLIFALFVITAVLWSAVKFVDRKKAFE